MKGTTINILVIMLLPIFGFSQIGTESDTSQTPNIVDSILNKTQVLENRWGEPLTSLLRQAEKVEVFHLDGFKSDDLEVPTLENFSIFNKATLNRAEEIEFQNLVTDTATYYLEKSAKQCLFMPRMGIRLSTEKDTVNVLISLKCDLIRFYFKNETLTLNSDDGRISVLDYFSKAFPRAVFVQPETFAAKSSRPIFYKVKPGDSWYKIHQTAKQNHAQNTTLEDLYKWNQILKNKQNHLQIGEEVIIGFE